MPTSAAADMPPPAPLSRQQAQRGQAAMIRVVLAGTANNALVQAVGPLFLLSLGATPFALGLLATVGQLDKLARLAGVALLGRGVGKARLMWWGRILAVPATLVLAATALLTPGHPVAVWLALIVIGGRGVLQQTGNAAWWPLIQDHTADTGLGQFLTRMRVRQRLLELAWPLAIGAWLGAAPAPSRFVPLFGLAVVALLLAALWVRAAAEQPAPATQAGLATRVRHTLAVPEIRRYCRYLLLRNALLNAVFPFWIVVLTGRGLPASHFVWMTSVLAAGQILSLWFWGRIVDGHGYRPVLTPCLAGMSLLAAAWLLLPVGGTAVLVWAIPFYLAWGVLEAGVQMGNSRAMVDAVPAPLQAEGFAVVIFASALGGGLGGFLGGLGFGAAGGWHPFGLDGGVAYLALVQGCFLLALFASRHIGPKDIGPKAATGNARSRGAS